MSRFANHLSKLHVTAWLIPGIAMLLGSVTPVLGAQTVLVGRNIPPAQRVPMQALRHDGWNQLLGKYVDQRGMVDYAGWRASTQDLTQLDLYLDQLSSVRLSDTADRSVRLAYWINAYNAVTIKGILREYPTSSIRNHTAKLVGYNIWKHLKLQVDGQQFSLDDMEHQILRKMGEPRIHFAIVCASVGCPRLLNEAYQAEKIDSQLSLNAKSFFSDRTKFHYDLRAQRIDVSPILNWFAKDFGRNQAEQLRTILPFVPEAAQGLLASGAVRIAYLDYDWSLNDQRPQR